VLIEIPQCNRKEVVDEEVGDEEAAWMERTVDALAFRTAPSMRYTNSMSEGGTDRWRRAVDRAYHCHCRYRYHCCGYDHDY
jgi:hypothetical protein